MYKLLPPFKLGCQDTVVQDTHTLLYVKCGATTTVAAAVGRIEAVAVAGWIAAAIAAAVATTTDPVAGRVGL